MFNWYSRNRRYEYGDYNKELKKYYNEDSGKWVSRINPKVVEEKYIRYEFSCFDDREIRNEFGYGSVDRVGKFLFLIFKKSIELKKRSNKDWVYIDKVNDEIKLLGDGKSRVIIERLVELKVLEIREGKRVFNKVVRLYRLNDEFFNCYRRRVWIRNTKVISLLDKRLGRITNNEFLKWEIESCKNLSIVEVDEGGLRRVILRRLSDRIFRDNLKLEWDFIGVRELKELELGWSVERKEDYVRRCEVSFELMQRELEGVVEGGVENSMFSIDDFGFRVFNIINTKEKEFRRYLRLENWRLVEVDMRNGYVSLLCRVFKGIRDLSVGESDFDDKIKQIVGEENGNDFLEMYEEICFKGKDRIDFYNYIGLKLFGIKKISPNDRDYIKELILYTINGKIDFSKNNRFINQRYTIDELGIKVFGENGWRCINKIKNTEISGWELYGFEKYKNMSKMLMRMEVLVMRERWKKLIQNNIYYISLFDGVLIGNNNIEKVLPLMNNNYGVDECISFRVSKNHSKKDI